MDRFRRDMTLLTSGALLGVAAVLLLDPRNRETLWRNVEGLVRTWVNDTEGDLDSIEQEAAATEGGLAGTRDWQKVMVSGGS